MDFIAGVSDTKCTGYATHEKMAVLYSYMMFACVSMKLLELNVLKDLSEFER